MNISCDRVDIDWIFLDENEMENNAISSGVQSFTDKSSSAGIIRNEMVIIMIIIKEFERVKTSCVEFLRKVLFFSFLLQLFNEIYSLGIMSRRWSLDCQNGIPPSPKILHSLTVFKNEPNSCFSPLKALYVMHACMYIHIIWTKHLVVVYYV